MFGLGAKASECWVPRVVGFGFTMLQSLEFSMLRFRVEGVGLKFGVSLAFIPGSKL